MRVFAGALVMTTKSKWKHKRSDIEAKDRNETKTFWCVPEPKVERFCLFLNLGTKPKLFDVFQLSYSKCKTFLFIPKILEQNQNFVMCSNFFLAKAKLYYLIQKLRNKTKTFRCSSQISKNKQNFLNSQKKIWKVNKSIAFGPNIFWPERERLGSIMNFVSKTNIFKFFGNVGRKTKANDLEKTLVWHY